MDLSLTHAADVATLALGTRAAGPLTVVIADDHDRFRTGIARAIGRRSDLRLLAEARDGDEALDLVRALRPDVAVLDHRMPGLTGVEVCAALQDDEDLAGTAVLLLSAFEDGEIVADAVRCGAAGYVGKTESHRRICDAIAEVGGGGIAFTDRTAAGFNRALRRRPVAATA
jgi:two-component system nitrate/nitrite response regulator NarL